MNLAIFKIFPAQGNAPAVLEVLESMRASLAPVAACLECTVAFETGEDGAIVYTERWQSGEALREHLRSNIFLRVLEAMEYSRCAPEIAFYAVSEVGGMEQIEIARAS